MDKGGDGPGNRSYYQSNMTEGKGMGVSEDESARLARHDEQITTLFNADIRLERCIEEIRSDLKQYANRLPVWATLLIGALMAVCGWLAAK